MIERSLHDQPRLSGGRPTRSLLALLLGVGCASYRPARYVDAPPVEGVLDDQPIEVPRRFEVPEAVALTDRYLRRPILGTMEVLRFPDAGDVNAWDEVPTSSWFEAAPARSAPPGSGLRPLPPFVLLSNATELVENGMRVRDARQELWELKIDLSHRPEMSTAAAAVGSAVAQALGYHVSLAHIQTVHLQDFVLPPRLPVATRPATDEVAPTLQTGPLLADGSFRVAAVQVPAGILVGVAPPGGNRRDDPNDRVPHQDRRTLRALRMVGEWIRMPISAVNGVDVYEGEPRRGHVVHYLAGFERGLGAFAVSPSQNEQRDKRDEVDGSILRNFLSFGLRKGKPEEPVQTRWLSLGQFGQSLPLDYPSVSAYEPADRISSADEYWMAKRMLKVSDEVLKSAVDAGALSDPSAQRELLQTLYLRRIGLARRAFESVSPLEMVELSGRSVILTDLPLAYELVPKTGTSYHVQLVDSEGRLVGRPFLVRPQGDRLRIDLPPEAEPFLDYLVVRVTVQRGDRMAPRAAEVHLRASGGSLRLLALRH